MAIVTPMPSAAFAVHPISAHVDITVECPVSIGHDEPLKPDDDTVSLTLTVSSYDTDDDFDIEEDGSISGSDKGDATDNNNNTNKRIALYCHNSYKLAARLLLLHDAEAGITGRSGRGGKRDGEKAIPLRRSKRKKGASGGEGGENLPQDYNGSDEDGEDGDGPAEGGNPDSGGGDAAERTPPPSLGYSCTQKIQRLSHQDRTSSSTAT